MLHLWDHHLITSHPQPLPVCCLLLQVVELMTGGAQTPVTNANKIFYLNLLAQYRLASQVKEEVEHFLKGEIPSTPGFEMKVSISMVWVRL